MQKLMQRVYAVALAVLCAVPGVVLGDQMNDDTLHWPVDYAELDAKTSKYYPTFSTGVKMDVDGRIDMKVRFVSLGTAVVFAQGYDATSQIQLLLVNGKWRVTYGSNNVPSTESAETEKDYEISFRVQDGKWCLLVNDQPVVGPKDVTALSAPPDGYGLTFWHRWLTSTSKFGDSPANYRLYWARVYHGDGTLQAEFLPEFAKLSNIGVYETKSGAEDSSANYKSDFGKISQDIRDYFCVTNTPAGGEEIASITSGLNTFLMTGYRLDRTDRVEMQFGFAEATSHRTIISSGSYCSRQFELLALSTGTWRPSYCGKTSSAMGNWSKDGEYTVSMSASDGLIVNSTKLGDLPNKDAESFESVDGLSFFSRMLSDVNGRHFDASGYVVLKWAKVYDKDSAVKAEFVPYMTADGCLGLWDKVGDIVYLPYSGDLSATESTGLAKVYVANDASGDDNNQGTMKRPVKTLKTALNRLGSGGVAYLQAGEYSVSAAVTLSNGESIEGLSPDPSRTVIRQTAANARVLALYAGSGLKNVTVSGGGLAGRGYALYGEDALVENCIFENNPGKSPSTSTKDGGAVYASGEMTVRNCIIRNNTATGKWTLGSAAMLLGTAKMENCLIYGNDYEEADERACTVYMTESAQMFNCTVADNRVTTTSGNHNGTAGIRVDDSKCRVVNCAIFGNRLDDQDSLLNSVARTSFSATFERCAGEYKVNSTCRAYADAKFTDAENGDYSLDKESPLVNRGIEYAGSDKKSYGTDLVGNPRYVGKMIDIGALEYQGPDPVKGLIIVVE